MKVECSNLKCKYMSDKGKCERGKINLSLMGVHTINMGFQDYLKCNSYEIDKEYRELEKKVKQLLLEGKDNEGN